MKDPLSVKHIHMVGIGGIGLSALARLLKARGAIVTGSDSSESPVVSGLREVGIQVAIGHRAEQVYPDTELLIHTLATSGDNPEIVAAIRAGIPTLTYPEALGKLTEEYETIAICGTHGKTTTTAMVASALETLSPNVIVGSLINGKRTNFVKGEPDSRLLVIEACEYRRSFLNYNPKVIVLTNIDLDHLDYFHDLADIQSSFREFAEKLPEDGLLIADLENETIKPILGGLNCRVEDWRNDIPEAKALDLQILGEHNIWNAACALAVAEEYEIEETRAKKALEEFQGTWRRMEEKGTTADGVLVYDDYGHNPTEIRATLKALRAKYPKKKMTVLFQPHLYSRTKLLLADFLKCFKDADKVLITDIYAAREIPDPSISGEILAKELGKHQPEVYYVGHSRDVGESLSRHLQKGELFLTIGAGDVYKVGEAFLISEKKL